jgi:hypothetical protein
MPMRRGFSRPLTSGKLEELSRRLGVRPAMMA